MRPLLVALLAALLSAIQPQTCVDLLNPQTGTSDCAQRSYLCNTPAYVSLMTIQCPATCGRCSTTNATSNSTGCADRLNPQTGSSDCPNRAYLCANPAYSSLMAIQCPATCGLCRTTSNSTTGCVDMVNPSTGVSDCPSRANQCNIPIFRTLMQQQCPLTCGFCSTTNTTTITTVTNGTTLTNGTVVNTVVSVVNTTSNCVDQTNPQTGSSDCPILAYLCTNPQYTTIMQQQCPLTCGICTASG